MLIYVQSFLFLLMTGMRFAWSLALEDVLNEMWSILVTSSWTSKYWTHFPTLKKAIFVKRHVHFKVAVRKKEPDGNSLSLTQAFGEAWITLKLKMIQISWQFHIYFFLLFCSGETVERRNNWNYYVKTGGAGRLKTANGCSDIVNKGVKRKRKTGKWNLASWQSL